MLRQGTTAQQAVDERLAGGTFPGEDCRQLAASEQHGNIAAVTGPNAPNWAGDRQAKT
jgi:uncharacterized Ntn-hydrolase superfamily protein